MPTVCKLLKASAQVNGVIPVEKVRAINARGGFLPANAAAGEWVQPEYMGTPTLLEEETFTRSNGHVPDLEVSLLRLTPGAKVIPHTGSSNARLNVHFGLKVPPESALKVGDQVRTWKVGEALVFDDSFDHEAWNPSDTDRVVLHMHMWNPALLPLAELLPEDLGAGTSDATAEHSEL